MARKPNYDFERKERERLKNEKKAARERERAKPEVAEGEAQPAGDEAAERE